MITTGSPVLLRGIDRAAFAVSLASRLRVGGVPVGLTGIEDFVRALVVAPPDSRSRLYWAARISLVRRHAEIEAFDAVFAAVFDDAVLELDPNPRRTQLPSASTDDDGYASVDGTPAEEQTGTGLPWTTLPRVVADGADADSGAAVPERLPSDLAGLADVPFEQLSAHEMQLLGRWLESAAGSWPTRRSRRFAADAGGRRIDVRQTIARSRRTGWEPIQLVRTKPLDKPRRVVMLTDVSQSMQAQAVAYVHLMRALVLTTDAEVFAFATTLTRLTTVLSHRSAEVAVDEATAKVADRFGGTRIAANLHTLLASHHGAALRGAVVLIGSDGWDSDTPEQLAAAMARLRRRAYRVVWLNPRASAPGFEPAVATMRAALPFCDALVPAASFRSLERVVAEISTYGRTATSTRSRGSTAGTGRR